MSALVSFGVEEEDVNAIESFDFTKHLVFGMGQPPERVEFLTRIDQVEFDDADQQKIIADMEGVKIPFLHLDHLILSKINTGRLKDQADIEELQKIQKARN